MTTDCFAASRLTIARQRRGLTKKALAENIGVSGAAITGFENGSILPSDEKVQRLSAALDFPIGFFYGEEIEPIHPGLASFRALRSMSARVRARVISAGHMAAGIISPHLDAKLTLPATQIPELEADTNDPAVAAEEVRKAWKLGQGPIENLIHLLEAKGVHIYWIDERSLVVDAVSFWQNGRPYIILNGQRPGERQRLSVGHEMGHLVFHRDVATNDREAENEAFAFASSLLLPERQFRKSFRSTSSFSELFSMLFRLKRDWGISVAAALRRSRELNLITEKQYENACRELSIQGMRKAEPGALPREKSLLHEKIFRRLSEENIAPEHLATELEISPSDLFELMPVSKQYRTRRDRAPEGPKLRLLE